MIRKWWSKQSRGNKVVISFYFLTSSSAFLITLIVGLEAMRDQVIPFLFKAVFVGGLFVGLLLISFRVFLTILTGEEPDDDIS